MHDFKIIQFIKTSNYIFENISDYLESLVLVNNEWICWNIHDLASIFFGVQHSKINWNFPFSCSSLVKSRNSIFLSFLIDRAMASVIAFLSSNIFFLYVSVCLSSMVSASYSHFISIDIVVNLEIFKNELIKWDK